MTRITAILWGNDVKEELDAFIDGMALNPRTNGFIIENETEEDEDEVFRTFTLEVQELNWYFNSFTKHLKDNNESTMVVGFGGPRLITWYIKKVLKSFAKECEMEIHFDLFK